MKTAKIGQYLLLSVYFLFAMSCDTTAQQGKAKQTNTSDADKLPLIHPNGKLTPLSNLLDSNLQKELDEELNANSHWKKLISQKKMAVGLVDLRDPESAKFARVNGLEMMYAASLPKIAILLAAMDAIDKGELTETPEIKKDMRIMISKSSNEAATNMIDRVGFDKIEAVMKDSTYLFYDEQLGGGLWVGKRYGSEGNTNREPLKQLSHAASVTQVCRFYYMLTYGELVSRDRSKQMLDIMGNPELHHKFVNSLEKIAPSAKLFRKSGSWKTSHADSILVWGTERKYILVALVDDPNGEQIIRQLATKIDKLVKTK